MRASARKVEATWEARIGPERLAQLRAIVSNLLTPP
jgi:hypothetical protein